MNATLFVLVGGTGNHSTGGCFAPCLVIDTPCSPLLLTLFVPNDHIQSMGPKTTKIKHKFLFAKAFLDLQDTVSFN